MRMITRDLLIDRLRMKRADLRVCYLVATINLVLTIWFNYTVVRILPALDTSAAVILWTVGTLYFARGFSDALSSYNALRASIRITEAELAEDAARRDVHDPEDL